MGSEREQLARRVSEQTAELSRATRKVGLNTLAYLLDAVRREASREFNWREDNEPGGRA
jgi:hypothetical protein